MSLLLDKANVSYETAMYNLEHKSENIIHINWACYNISTCVIMGLKYILNMHNITPKVTQDINLLLRQLYDKCFSFNWYKELSLLDAELNHWHRNAITSSRFSVSEDVMSRVVYVVKDMFKYIKHCNLAGLA